MQFKNLSDVRRYLETQIADTMEKHIAEVVKEEMSKSVENVVYKAYDPFEYERREDEGGLSDTDNMNITEFDVKDSEVSMLVENLTRGSNDIFMIGDLVEYGHGYDGKEYTYPYNRDGTAYKFLKSRPFAKDATERMKEEGVLEKELKLGLLMKGIDVK